MQVRRLIMKRPKLNSIEAVSARRMRANEARRFDATQVERTRAAVERWDDDLAVMPGKRGAIARALAKAAEEAAVNEKGGSK